MISLDTQVLGLLSDMIRSGDPKRIQLASSLLRHGPRHFVLQHTAFVEEAIGIAELLDNRTQSTLMHGLHSSALYGSWCRSIGTDDPDQVALRDGAAAIAERHPINSRVRSFYEYVAERAYKSVQEERDDDRSFGEPRRW
jgi:hypothetical protein